jgi:hypothetical protein
MGVETRIDSIEPVTEFASRAATLQSEEIAVQRVVRNCSYGCIGRRCPRPNMDAGRIGNRSRGSCKGPRF